MGIFTDEQQALLNAKLDAGAVSERQGLSYIEAWHAINEANRIFGFGMWDTKLIELRHIGDEVNDKGGGKVQYRSAYLAAYEVTVKGAAASALAERGLNCTYQDVGFGNATSYSNPLDNHENAAKEAATDAVKRCLRNLGNQFGNALYDKQQRNVAKNVSADDVLKLMRKLQKLGKGDAAKEAASGLLNNVKLADADADTVNAVFTALEKL